MSIYSTLDITRADALSEILKKLSCATDAELEEVLFALFAERTWYNFNIVPSYNKAHLEYKPGKLDTE